MITVTISCDNYCVCYNCHFYNIIVLYFSLTLSAQIQALKHSVPKGDKKKKKQVANEIALLTAQLEEQQAKELLDVSKFIIVICHLYFHSQTFLSLCNHIYNH